MATPARTKSALTRAQRVRHGAAPRAGRRPRQRCTSDEPEEVDRAVLAALRSLALLVDPVTAPSTYQPFVPRADVSDQFWSARDEFAAWLRARA